MMKFLPLFFSYATAAIFGVFSDPECKDLVIPVLAHTDVCTWNTYTTSYSLYLDSCTAETFKVVSFNATDAPSCISYPVNQTFTVHKTCQSTYDYYTKILDTENCLGVNTTYNIVAHNTQNCSDPGVPFSVFNQNNSCVGDSFGPGLTGASFDTEIVQTDNIFLLEVFASKDGTCEQVLDIFGTKEFGSTCLSPISGEGQDLFIQVWRAFPLV